MSSPTRSLLTLILLIALLVSVTFCTSRETLEDPPIITSATYQHTLYNGQPQPIEARAAKEVPPFVITYFNSEADLLSNTGGTAEVPSEVGAYYVRIERPAGKGYKAGKPIKVEYYIQKTFVPIEAEAIQEFDYDGNPKAAVVKSSVTLVITYYAETAPELALPGPPVQRGRYRAAITYPGDGRYMGASRDIELVIN
ncbi:hypothetical protein [Leadbettera azotonutricia]|uniref:Uncharacterized protein n=1 Tax=Leadbettera azotonutricia (strain ATCC BAA-888 / DSM 13862 / ZAS-9) TaxID=545695 RepID=F5YDF1_LEAAZ|nr:hypothetical protein [Leadbettera azotonutricia]AEF82513.1 hypothetical protein TREAZ_1602 [Leadbettera azotonutricia ZAS-9]